MKPTNQKRNYYMEAHRDDGPEFVCYSKEVRATDDPLGFKPWSKESEIQPVDWPGEVARLRAGQVESERQLKDAFERLGNAEEAVQVLALQKAQLEAELEAKQAGLAAAEERNRLLSERLAFWEGCSGCGEYHDPEVMCPPHEMRTTGMAWFQVRINKALKRAREAEADKVRLARDKESLCIDLGTANGQIVRLRQQLAETEAGAASLRQALECCQWGNSVGGDEQDTCPVCDFLKEYGHEANCAVGRALAIDIGKATLAKIERHGTLLELAAQLLEQAATDIDRMFPNDECPEMQQDLRLIAERFRNELKGVKHG